MAPSQYDLGSSHQEHDQSDHQNGPEYGRTVGKLGGQRKVESELMAREERVKHLAITPLAPSEAATFSQAWNTLQGRFFDNPQGVVVQAAAPSWSVS
jgi:hypothetical protein